MTDILLIKEILAKYKNQGDDILATKLLRFIKYEGQYINRKKPEHLEWRREYARKNRKKISKQDYECKKRNPEALKKMKIRAQTRIAVKKGVIEKKPCEVCNNQDSQCHHINYENPYNIRWLCRDHHMELHIK